MTARNMPTIPIRKQAIGPEAVKPKNHNLSKNEPADGGENEPKSAVNQNKAFRTISTAKKTI
jgi:hypothetical protein